MTEERKVNKLGDLVVCGSKISRNVTRLAQFPTDIAEVAQLDGSIFVILSVPSPESDLAYAGTNLWCLDVSGNILWKAPNLNSGQIVTPAFWECWSALKYSTKTIRRFGVMWGSVVAVRCCELQMENIRARKLRLTGPQTFNAHRSNMFGAFASASNPPFLSRSELGRLQGITPSTQSQDFLRHFNSDRP